MALQIAILIVVTSTTRHSMASLMSTVHRDYQSYLPCIHDIISHHFTGEGPVLVSMTNEFRLDDFLYQLNKANLWSLFVSMPKENSPEVPFNAHMQHQGYVYFLHGESEDLLENLITQVEAVKRKGLNPRARFLLVIDSGQQSTAQFVAEEMWHKYFISDVIILIDDAIYMRRPYDVACLEVIVALITTCQKTSHVLLHPNKIHRTLHGCPLRVTPAYTPPYLVTVDDERRPAGLEVAIAELIFQVFNANVIYQKMSTDDDITERHVTTFQAVLHGKTDVIFGDYSIHPGAVQLCDFTNSYLRDVVRWYVPCGVPYLREQRVAAIFTASVWFTQALIFLIAVAALRVSTRNDSPLYRCVTTCVYAVWALSLSVSVPEQPRTGVPRMIFICLVWYCFAMSTVFQTYFTSILVHPGSSDHISSSEELFRSNLVYYFDKEFDNYIRYENKCLLDYFGSQSIAILSFDFMTEFFMNAILPDGSSVPQICKLSEDIAVIQLTMYLFPGSPLRSSLSSIIRSVVEAGLINKLVDVHKSRWHYLKWSEDKDVILDSVYRVNKNIVEYFVFSISHMKIAFYILATGIAIGMLVLAGEILFSRTCISK